VKRGSSRVCYRRWLIRDEVGPSYSHDWLGIYLVCNDCRLAPQDLVGRRWASAKHFVLSDCRTRSFVNGVGYRV